MVMDREASIFCCTLRKERQSGKAAFRGNRERMAGDEVDKRVSFHDDHENIQATLTMCGVNKYEASDVSAKDPENSGIPVPRRRFLVVLNRRFGGFYKFPLTKNMRMTWKAHHLVPVSVFFGLIVLGDSVEQTFQQVLWLIDVQ